MEYRNTIIVIVTIINALLLTGCVGLSCGPLTDNTCVKSKYVTGECRDGVCVCIHGTVPDDFGCHESFRPNVSVSYPESWSGEIHSDGYVIVLCSPDTFPRGSYRWFRDGTEIKEELVKDTVIRDPPTSTQIQCSIIAYGVETERSEPLQLTVGGIDELFTKKPVVSGMPTQAAINSTVSLKCDNLPATYNWYQWHINGKRVGRVNAPSVTIMMTEDRFDASITCTMDHRNYQLSMMSDPVMTPSSPAVDIPGVHITGHSGTYEYHTISLSCDLDSSFTTSPSDKISYTWRFNNVVLSGETSSTYVKGHAMSKDSGNYSCSASYKNNAAKISSDFQLEISPGLTEHTSVKRDPKKAVIGGHLTLICDVEGHDPTDLHFSWEEFALTASGVFQTIHYVYYSDNMIQVNNISPSFNGVFSCSTYSGKSSGWIHVEKPVAISNGIQPTVMDANTTTTSKKYTLSCDSDYGTPGMQYRWFIDGTEQNDAHDQLLGVNDKVTPTEITCQMQFNSGQSNLSTSFMIPADGSVASPVLQVQGQPSTFIAGASYVFDCSSISHSQNAVYSWWKDDVTLADISKTITIDNMQSVNDGNYNCNITVGGQTKQSTNSLSVRTVFNFQRPKVEVIGLPSIIMAGKSYALECVGESRTETVTYEWSKDNVDLEVNNPSLSIANAQSAHTGNYTCSMKIGSVTMATANALPFVVEELVAPTVQVLENPYLFLKDGDYSLQCVSPTNAESYTWKKDDSHLSSTDKILTLPSLQPSDSGNYTCIITLGEKSKEARKPLEIKVSTNGKYCSSASDCDLPGFDKKTCSGLQCKCLPKHKFETDKGQCVLSRCSRIQLGISTMILAMITLKLLL